MVVKGVFGVVYTGTIIVEKYPAGESDDLRLTAPNQNEHSPALRGLCANDGTAIGA